MKRIIIFTTLLLVALPLGMAHGDIHWLNADDEAHEYVFAVEENGGTFFYPPAYLNAVNPAPVRKASIETNVGESDPYNSIVETSFSEFGDTIPGAIRMLAGARGPDLDGSGDPLNPPGGLKVQAYTRIIPTDFDGSNGINVTQKANAWSTRWFTVDEKMTYNLQADLGGAVNFDAFGDAETPPPYAAYWELTAQVSLEAMVVSQTGQILLIEEISNLPVDFDAPVSTNLTLSPTNAVGQALTYQLKVRVNLESNIVNLEGYETVTGNVSGTFDIGTPDNPIAIAASVRNSDGGYTLTTSVDSGNGTISPTTGSYDQDEVVPLTAVPASGYTVASWSGTDNDSLTATTNTVTMTEDKVVSVSFSTVQHTLTAAVSGDGGTVSPTNGAYDQGTVVTLTADPAAGYAIASWSGTDDDSSTAETNTVTITEDKTVFVQFRDASLPSDQYLLSTEVIGGSGTLSPTNGTYDQGTVVALTADTAAGYEVASWSGTDNDNSTAETNTVTMDSDKIVMLTLQEHDADTDGIDNLLEQGPDPDNPDPEYDGNGDGLPDCHQTNVASAFTHDGQHYVTLACGPGMELKDVAFVAPAAGAPADYDFPFGFVDFRIEGLAPGAAATVTLHLPAGQTPDTYFKYGPTPGDASEHWYEFLSDGTTGAVINANTIELTFVDGQRGDDDLQANGIIVDQGGPALQNTIPVPASGGSSGGGCFVSSLDRNATGYMIVGLLLIGISAYRPVIRRYSSQSFWPDS